ncbi:MFS transporter [Nocardia sp. NPDC004068]|uniref:MFS transporter n=1 Tax=Nocardia sp. NPDC004068 TaxID=3364303 RepID=UPI0036776F9F
MTDVCVDSVARQGVSGGWPAVAVVAAGTFTAVTSEMLPVGLLTPVGAGLGISDGRAGSALTITGVLAMTAPLVPVVWGRVDRRVVLCVMLGVVAVGNLLSAVAPGFGTLVAGRVLIGVGMGGVWAVSGSLGARLVGAGSVGRATSVIFSGVAVASVLGVPAGTYLGSTVGWRWAFGAAALLALGVAAAVTLVVPSLPAARAASPRALPALLARPSLRTGMIVVVLLVTGHFAAYTYIRPFLEQATAATAPTIGTVLLGYGIAGVAGTFTLGALAARAPRRAVLLITLTLPAAVAALALTHTLPVATTLLVVWGVAYGGVSVTSQNWTVAAAPDAREAASAILVAVFNGSIALGALVGGGVVDGFGIRAGLWSCVGLVVAAGVVAAVGARPAATR